MLSKHCDVAVIGAGPAGLAAAAAARQQGAQSVLLVDRDRLPGGILRQCIHPGFGLLVFGEELTGPEYAQRFIEKAHRDGVELLMDTMVLEIQGHRLVCMQGSQGVVHVEAKAIVLAMGCRERTRAGIHLPGTRPAGIYTAGAAQRLINRQNMMVGRKFVILGSGDVGMIMARRLTIEGAKVIAVIELMHYLTGLTRNRVQCLDDFGIPLYLSHTITLVEGHERVTGVRVAKVDEDRRPIRETEWLIPCDTLLLSVGLIPENELSLMAHIDLCPVTRGPMVNSLMQTSVEHIFASGNVVHVNDLVDQVTMEGELAGRAAAMYATGTLPRGERRVCVRPGKNVIYLCPQFLTVPIHNRKVDVFFRVGRPERNVRITVHDGETTLFSAKRARVNPGEMEHIQIDADILRGDTLTVHVEKEGLA